MYYQEVSNVLHVKSGQVCRNYQEVKERLEDKLINRIGFENPAFEFDPKSQMEIKNGCRLLYNLCERDTYEDIKVRLYQPAFDCSSLL